MTDADMLLRMIRNLQLIYRNRGEGYRLAILERLKNVLLHEEVPSDSDGAGGAAEGGAAGGEGGAAEGGAAGGEGGAAAGELAFTGNESMVLLIVGLSLGVAGAMVLHVSRRLRDA